MSETKTYTNKEVVDYIRKIELEKINLILNSYLEVKVPLYLDEKEYGDEIYLYIISGEHNNLKKYCGIMSKAFKEVNIKGRVWSYYCKDTDRMELTIDFCFNYEHVNGGSNGANFLRLYTKNENVFIKNLDE